MTNTAFAQAAKAQSATKETVERYRKIADYAFRRFRASETSPDAPAIDTASETDVRRFVAWLADRRPSLTRAAFRQLKAAASHRLGELGHHEAQGDLEALDCRPCRERLRRNAKKLSLSDYERLLGELVSVRGQWGRRAAALLTATLMTGLRPHEWRDSYYAGRGALVVRNAKFSNGRAGVPTRELLLDAEAAGAVSTLFDAEAEWERDARPEQPWETFINVSSHMIARAVRHLWPKRMRPPSLYSARHQFVADLKSAGVPPDLAARILGHSSVFTARMHYGRSSAGWGAVHVRYRGDEGTPIITPIPAGGQAHKPKG